MFSSSVHKAVAAILVLAAAALASGCETIQAHHNGDIALGDFMQMARLDTNYPVENNVGFSSLKQADSWLRENLW